MITLRFSPSQNPLQFSLPVETLVGRACGKQIKPHSGCRQYSGKAGDYSETSSTNKIGGIRDENGALAISLSSRVKLTLLSMLPEKIGRWIPVQTAVADLPPSWSRCYSRRTKRVCSWGSTSVVDSSKWYGTNTTTSQYRRYISY